jgi:hypothetical protein
MYFDICKNKKKRNGISESGRTALKLTRKITSNVVVTFGLLNKLHIRKFMFGCLA